MAVLDLQHLAERAGGFQGTDDPIAHLRARERVFRAIERSPASSNRRSPLAATANEYVKDPQEEIHDDRQVEPALPRPG